VKTFQERAKELTVWHPCIIYLLVAPPHCSCPACALTLATVFLVYISFLPPSPPHGHIQDGAARAQGGEAIAQEPHLLVQSAFSGVYPVLGDARGRGGAFLLAFLMSSGEHPVSRTCGAFSGASTRTD